MRRPLTQLALAVVTVAIGGGGHAARAAAPAGAVGAWVDIAAHEAMGTGLTPGMSIAVVADHRIVCIDGVGWADREQHRPVVPSTRFYIASTTKALTGLAIARVAARGGLDLEAPLSRALPGARLAPGINGDSIRVRDLATHTHGIDGTGPITVRVAFTGEYANNDELLRLLAFHPPEKTGRAYHYSNLGYDLLGILLAPEGRDGWKDVVTREVTVPLGMTATSPWRSRVPADSIALPYEMGPQGLESVPLAKEDANMGPAGGLFSTAADLARLVLAELDGGRIGGVQAIEPGVIAETQRKQVSQDRVYSLFHRYGWGLGWDLGTYDGDTLVHRFGSFAGYRSHMSFMPRHGIGVVVLVNGGAAGPVADAVAASIYDHFRGRDSTKARLEARLEQAVARGRRMSHDIATERALRHSRPRTLPLPLAVYAGSYVSPSLGTLTLRVEKDHLVAEMGVARSPVEVEDASKQQLRVELLGGKDVLTALPAGDGRSITAVDLADERFERRPDAGGKPR